MTDWAREETILFLCGLLTLALGKGIKLLLLPHVHLPPTITPIEPASLGVVTLIFNAHLHPPATAIPTGNIISLHVLCIQHKRAGECAVCRCLCVGAGRLGCFPLCIHGCDMPVVKRVLKRVQKVIMPQGCSINGTWFTLWAPRQNIYSILFVSTLEKVILQVLQCSGTKFPAETEWVSSVHLSMCTHMWMYTVPHAEKAIKR